MADGTGIEWTDATWNPVTGCSIVSPGCTNCYAMKLAGTRLAHIPSRAGLTRGSKAGPVWTGEVRFNVAQLTWPLKWTRARKVFVCAHGDLFAENVPDDWIDQVFAVMVLSPRHVFQVLTKRPERMREYLAQVTAPGRIWFHVTRLAQKPSDVAAATDRLNAGPLSNCWLGTSVEDQRRADERRAPMAALAAIGWLTWVSYEPALGAVDWVLWPFLRWLVSGGESGRDARFTDPAWHRAARDFCAGADVAYFFKQHGEWLSLDQLSGSGWEFRREVNGVRYGRVTTGGFEDPAPAFGGRDFPTAYPWNRPDHNGPGPCMVRVGKKNAGRLLDGVEHNAMPVSP